MLPKPRSSHTKQKALSIAQAAQEKKGSDVLVLEVRELTSIADYFVFTSGESERQVKAIADNIERVIASRYRVTPAVEGTEACTWILLDYGDIVVHVFRSDVRGYYALEDMWADASPIPVPEDDASPASPALPFAKPTAPVAAEAHSIR